MATPVSIVWFRNDLRISDHPALNAAFRLGGAVIPVYIWSPQEEGAWPPGAASRWWLHQSLKALDASLRSRGSRLIFRKGESLGVLNELMQTTGATHVFWTRRYEPAGIARDQQIKASLRADCKEADSFNGALLIEPWLANTKAGGPFQVFTPFWRTVSSQIPSQAIRTLPERWPAPSRWPASLPLEDLALEPRIRWADTMAKCWSPGELGAGARLQKFLNDAVLSYSENRNLPASAGTSMLSPHLHFGEISPRQIWNACAAFAVARGIPPEVWKAWQFVTELGWREFGYHLLFHFPQTPEFPLRHAFLRFPWREDSIQLKAWQRGRTGYPLVDAGMRELWAHGWMHNRVRMVVASFLVKHLRIGWSSGASWFWDTLVDADLASNTLGWQWTAGCGADAAPYFRIFNPITQGEKFDPNGDYVQRWVPELAKVPSKWIHSPWLAPSDILRSAGVTMGRDYPLPIVDHAEARKAALAAYATL